MYTITSPIFGDSYQKIVKLLIEQSDSFIFHLPNNGKVLINERNVDSMPDFPIGYTESEDQDLHAAYIKTMQDYLDLIREDIISVKKDVGYLDQITNREMEVYHVRISENTLSFFSTTVDFFRWRYPALPENPCFIKEGKCIFHCIAHENICFLNVDDKRIVKILKKNHIEFFKSL